MWGLFQWIYLKNVWTFVTIFFQFISFTFIAFHFISFQFIASFTIRIQYIIYVQNMCYLLSVRLLFNSRLLVIKFWRSQKLYGNFQLCKELVALTPALTRSQVRFYQTMFFKEKRCFTLSLSGMNFEHVPPCGSQDGSPPWSGPMIRPSWPSLIDHHPGLASALFPPAQTCEIINSCWLDSSLRGKRALTHLQAWCLKSNRGFQFTVRNCTAST